MSQRPEGQVLRSNEMALCWRFELISFISPRPYEPI
jgi:hypothetical protein